MDGVLIEAKDWHYEALNKALDYFGMPISRYDHLTTYDGYPTKKKLEILTLEKNLPEGLHSFIYELKQQYTVDVVQTKCKPSFVHQYALSKLKNDGYRLAVCSNAIRSSVELMLEKAGLLKYCDFFLSNEDVQHSKPHPEMYITAVKKLGLQPKECLVIEDNPKGQKAALDSGVQLMKVLDPHDVNYDHIKMIIKNKEQGSND